MTETIPYLDTLTADEILNIPENKPFILFSGDSTISDRQYKALVRHWHPDRNPAARAGIVTAHIIALYNNLTRMQDAGRWTTGRTLHLRDLDGRRFRLTFRRAESFVLGEAWLARRHLAFAVRPRHRDLLRHALRIHERLPLAGPEMAGQMEGLLPAGDRVVETLGGPVLVMGKAPGLVRLDHLIAHCGGRLEARHAAWVLGGLYHLACYLDHAGLAHQGLAPDTVFIDPAEHRVALPAAWWYAAPFGSPLKVLPRWTLDQGPAGLRRDPVARSATDLELIKALGRAMLAPGNSGPEPLRRWLNLPAGDAALQEYQGWQHVLDDSFGARRFVRLAAGFDTVYPNTGEN